MNLKNLFKLTALLFVFFVMSSGVTFGQKYVNSTDGDDSYTGENPTNNPLGTGPKRTIEGAFQAFASGETVYIAAGVYNYDQSGIGGGNDANGYTIGTGANKSMTFIAQTYNANDVVTLNGGPLTLNIGTGTLTFQSETAGVQSFAFSGASVTLTSGTWDVTGTTLNVGAGTTTMTRTDGALVGSPSYANNGMTVIYNSTSSKTAGGEMPSVIAALTLSHTAGTITFPNPISFRTNGGGITNTTGNDAAFNGLVTLRANAGNNSPTIVNSQAGADWTFAGGVTVQTTQNNGTPIANNNTGSVKVTGPLTFEQRDVAGVADANHTSTVSNTAAGNLSLTGGVLETSFKAAAPTNYTVGNTYTPVVNFNLAAGTASIGGGTSTTFTGTYGTAGGSTATLTGPVTVNGAVTNAGTTSLGANDLTVTANGAVHTSAGNVTGSGTLVFMNTAPTTWAGAGSLPNVKVASTTAGATVTISQSTTLTGGVTSTSSNLLTLSAAANIGGGISISSSGGVTLGVAGTVQGPVSITGTGVLTTNVTNFNSSVSVANGGFTLGGNITVQGNYSQSGGALTFGANTFDLKGNFDRTSGTVTPGTGTLSFSAGGSQTFSGGTNMQVYNFGVTGVGTGVTFVNGSLEVLNNATIVSNTNVKLGTYNIRMLGNGGATPTFANAGQYTSEGGGGIIFEGPVVGQHYISGNGVNSNIEVRLSTEAQFVDVADGEVVTWSGLLTLTRGTIRVGNAGGGTEQFNPSTILTTPTLRRNLGDTGPANGVADGYPINVGADGTFNATSQSYHLVYFGTLTANQGVGPEFISGTTPRVINLTVTASGGGNAVQLGNAEYRFSGNLLVGNSANLQLQGAGNNNLVSTGTDVEHTINGTVSRTNTGSFVLAGSGVVNGGTKSTAPADAATIADLTVNTSGQFDINNLKLIGMAGADALNVAAGTANIGMQLFGTPADQGNIRNFNQTGGTATLTADADLTVAFNQTGGTFDLANQNLYMDTPGGSFTVAAPAVVQATGADAKGWLVFDAAGTLNTGTVNIPKLYQGLNAAANVTLGGNAGVSSIFTQKAGALELGANTLRLTGTEWNYNGGTVISTAGNGVISVLGPVTASFAASLSVPNLTLNNPGDTLTLVDNDGAAGTVPTLSLTDPGAAPGVLTITDGTLNFGTMDIALNDAGGVFAYAAGDFMATTTNTVTATDNQNGELVFNGGGAAQTYAVGATGLVLPNVRVAGTGGVSLAAAPNNKSFTISMRLVLDGPFNFTTDGALMLGDGAWIKRTVNTAVLDKVPTFGNGVNLEYEAAAAIVPAKEMPGTVTGLYVDNAAGIDVDASMNVKVTDELNLYSGNYDFEQTTGKIYPIEMGAGALVSVRDGWLYNSGSLTVTTLTGGPVILGYVNTIARATTSAEFPGTAGFVSELDVMSDLPVAGTGLVLHASRNVGSFVLWTGEINSAPAAIVSTEDFDLNAKTLGVDSSATLTRGVLSSRATTGTVYTYGTLNVGGEVNSTANTSVQNVNIMAGMMNLAGTFGRTDWDGAGVNTLPAGWPSSTVSGDATVGTYAGNLTVGGNTTVGAHSNGTITASQDVTVTTNIAASSNIAFVDSANAKLTVPGAGAVVGGLMFGKDNNTNTITLEGGNITTTATTVFVNGLFVTGNNTFNMWQPAFGGGQGFTRAGVTGGNISHVVGNVLKTAVNAGGPGLGAPSTEPRMEFPVGTMTLYRPAAITFNPKDGLPTQPNASFIVNHVNVSPTGTVGLPIEQGVNDSTAIARYPGFYWNIASTPFSIGPSTPFDLELTASGFTDYVDLNNVRIIRRQGTITDVENQWLLQGSNDSYDNELSLNILSVIQRNANAGLRNGGAIFTLGLPTNIMVANPLEDIEFATPSDDPASIELEGVFEGYENNFVYTAQSSNQAVARVSVRGGSLIVTPVAEGEAIVSVTATAPNNDFVTTTFKAKVGLVGVDLNEIPTEFSLAQNYPNPFNPSTVIRFGLPHQSNVVLKVYNVLGEEVATLINDVKAAGWYEVNFDATKLGLSSGLYIYRINAEDFVSIKKMMLVK